MPGPKTLPRERAERFHRARIDRAGSPRDGMAGAWCWLLAELRKADQAVAREAMTETRALLVRVAHGLNQRRGARS